MKSEDASLLNFCFFFNGSTYTPKKKIFIVLVCMLTTYYSVRNARGRVYRKRVKSYALTALMIVRVFLIKDVTKIIIKK